MDKKKLLKIILPVSVIVFLLSSYWIYKNVKIEDLIGDSSVSIDGDIVDHQSKFKEFEIKDDDIVLVLSSGEFEILVNGEAIEGLESIVDLSVSPDGKKMCFLVQTMVPMWLYIYDLEKEELIKVDTAKNCYWSPDSRYLAYNNHTTDVSDIDIHMYEFDTGDIENVSKDIIPVPTDLLRQCQETNWVDDNSLQFECQLRKISNFDDYSVIGVNYNLPSKKISQEVNK